MTVEQRDKYAYELMVKNNPEEAVKQLLSKDKVIEELKTKIKNAIECIGYEDYVNTSDLLRILDGEQNDN